MGTIKNANARVEENGQLIGNFIYNMVDYISWKNTDKVVVCSYGHDEVSEALENLKNKHSNTDNKLRDVKIHLVDNVKMSNVTQCNILYFSRYEEDVLPQVLDHIQNLPILTVSNIEHFVDLGGIMEFKISRQKLKLRLGKEALDKAGIRLSPVILMSIKPESD